MGRKRKHEAVEVETEATVEIAAKRPKSKRAAVSPTALSESSRKSKKSRKNKDKEQREEGLSSATLHSSPTDSMELAEEEVPQDSKGKSRAAGWGAPPAATESAEVADLKEEIAKLKEEVAFKQQVLITQKDLINTVQSAVNCHICMETFKEPMTLICGHTFCGSCIWDCFHAMPTKPTYDQETHSDGYANFADTIQGGIHPGHIDNIMGYDSEESDRDSETSVELVQSKKTLGKLVCPDCRHIIDVAPIPIFVVKDVADQIRLQEQPAGLLFDGARAASDASAAVRLPSPVAPPKSPYQLGARSPRLPKSPEPVKKPIWDSKDKTWAGLFPEHRKGDAYSKATRRGLPDLEDGVRRCIYCNWEIEDGDCGHCGAQYADSEDELHILAHHDSGWMDDEDGDEDEDDVSNISGLIAEDDVSNISDLIADTSSHPPIIINDSDSGASDLEGTPEEYHEWAPGLGEPVGSLAGQLDGYDEGEDSDSSDGSDSSHGHSKPVFRKHRTVISDSDSPARPSIIKKRSANLDSEDLQVLDGKKQRGKKQRAVEMSSDEEIEESADEEIPRPSTSADKAALSKNMKKSLSIFARAVNGMRRDTDDEEAVLMPDSIDDSEEKGDATFDSENQVSSGRLKSFVEDVGLNGSDVEQDESAEEESEGEDASAFKESLLVDTDAGSNDEDESSSEEAEPSPPPPPPTKKGKSKRKHK